MRRGDASPCDDRVKSANPDFVYSTSQLQEWLVIIRNFSYYLVKAKGLDREGEKVYR